MSLQKGRVALVTGSTRGIGRGIALRLARDGYRVVVSSINADPESPNSAAAQVVRTIEEEGGEAVVCRADVASAEDRHRLLDFVADRFDRLDLLVNNAGVAPLERKDIIEADAESFDRLMAINLRGPYFLTQLAAARMIAWQASGRVPKARIAFVTSISAYAASIARGDYCISKAGLSMAAKLFAARLAEYEIPVIEIQPGIIATDMTSAVKEKYDKLIAEGLLPTRRWGEVEDVAAVVSAFGNGQFDYSTGQIIEVGGGFGLRRL